MKNPFKLTIYDKDFRRKGWLGDAISVVATPAHNDQQSITFTTTSNNSKLPLLMADGARLTCEYGGRQIISGPVRSRGGSGPSASGELTFTVPDDYRLLTRVLGWPVPAADLASQTAEYDTRSGPAESVLKAFVQANAVDRLGLPISVAPDLGRGANITVSMRFHPLFDRLFPAFDGAGLGVTVKQAGAGLVVDCYEPKDYPRILSEAAGTVKSWSWTNAAPEATRGVVGGQGEGVARTFHAFVDPLREAQWGDVIEVFRDARDSSSGDVYAERAAETLSEGSEKSGLKLTLSETPQFRYGHGVLEVGDRISLKVGPGLVITDTLRSATISWKRDGGLEVIHQVGEITDDPDLTFGRALRKTYAAIRNFRSM
ncbi:MAG: hypothetical protein HIU81_03895 [Acidobacteria bacterium]|nr:hypothetical protein [Acidobacteriota bacterium]